MMSSVLAFVFAAMVVTINGQGMFSSLMNGAMGGGLGGAMGGMGAMGAMGGMGGGMGAMGGMPAAFAGAAGMTGGMPMALPPSQTQNLMQQFFFYRLMFGDAAARLIVADRMANMLGGNMMSRYYAGEYFDTPDSWWITSSLMNRNNMAANTNGGTGIPTTGTTNPSSGTIGGGTI